MKPIKLTMQAFGPYKYKEVIDFTELKENRLFVISGNTGAGKTTIFDGIAFALYGQASGEDRKDHKSLRSDFAEDQTHTMVELFFETRGKTYRILRQLAHIKKGRKTASGENFEFMEVMPDGQEVVACEKQKAKEISQKIEELIGLTYDQFNQIVMLPQGEFRKLLTSSTENKEVILRKIFKTERYSKIAERLEDKKKLAEKQRDEAKTLRDMYIDQIMGALPIRDSELFARIAGDANIYQIIESLQAEKAFYEAKQTENQAQYNDVKHKTEAKQQEILTIEQQNKRLFKLQQAKQELLEKQAQIPQFEAIKQEVTRANIALQLAPILDGLRNSQGELQQQEQKLEELQQQFEQAKTTFQLLKSTFEQQQKTEVERKQLEQTIHELQKVDPLFLKVTQLNQLIAQAQQQLIVTEKNVAVCQNEFNQKMQLLQQLKVSEQQLDKAVQDLPNAVMRNERLQHTLMALAQYAKANKTIALHEQQLQGKHEYLQQVQLAYTELEQAWLSNQAIEIAAHLVEGDPCPVCGSKVHDLTHIQPNGHGISKEMLNAKKVELEKVSREYYSAEAALNAGQQQLQLQIQLLMEQQVDPQKQADYQAEAQQLAINIQQLQQQQTILQQTKNERSSIEQQLQQLQQQQNDLSEQMLQLRLQIETKKVELESIQQQIPTEYDNHAALQQAIMQKTQRYKQLQQAFETAKQAYENAQMQMTRVSEALRYTDDYVQSLRGKLKQQLEQWEQVLAESPFENEMQYNEAIRTRMQIEQLQQQYESFNQQLFSLKQYVENEDEQLKGIEVKDMRELHEQLQELREQYELAHKILLQTEGFISDCHKYEENLSQVAEKIVQLEEVANNILNLYNILNGKNAKRISFERYVQVGFLEQITAVANERLRKLSNGQYELVSSERQVGHGRQSGLSLDVLDSLTGQKRDVKTLSGGEKFNASLCLALGMADVIQSYEGNVRIDTMFIDEGFGTLDEESLQKAIDTLIDLQQTGRIIGVISHVAELKEAMPAILEVQKLKEGFSKTKITIK